jgi:hypothetical protein
VNLGRVRCGHDEATVIVGFDMGRLWWRRTPHLAAAGSPAWRGAAAYGAFVAVMAGGLLPYIPRPPGPAAPPTVRTVAAFHRIILPDLAVVDAAGIRPARLARIGKMHGVRQVMALDGAQVHLGSRKVNVIGVDAQLYRSWTPLRTASNQRLWNALASGGFVVSPQARHRLRLQTGSTYPLTGATTVNLTDVGTAPLGIGGIDVVVAAQASARLGLIRHVAALISAPSVSMRKLRHKVRAVVGGRAKLFTLRQSRPTATASVPTGRPTTYIQLFQESAAQYCPGLPWTVLAAIGQIESADGANMGPSTAGALGPMQFLPSTWREWGITATQWGQTGPPDIMDAFDAVPSAALYLCAAGGATAAGLPGAIFAYNHAHWYVAEVLALAKAYAQTPSP